MLVKGKDQDILYIYKVLYLLFYFLNSMQTRVNLWIRHNITSLACKATIALQAVTFFY